MTDLTEQMKKGELPYAEYYIKLAGGEYTNDVWDFDGWQSFNKEGDVVVEVLAPVPSYEKWIMTKNLSERAHLEMYKARGEKVRLEKENTKLKSKLQLKETAYDFDTARLEEENAQLKELLRECSAYISEWDTPMNILAKIDEVLGEKE